MKRWQQPRLHIYASPCYGNTYTYMGGGKHVCVFLLVRNNREKTQRERERCEKTVRVVFVFLKKNIYIYIYIYTLYDGPQKE